MSTLTLRPNGVGTNSGWSVGAGSGTKYLNVDEAVSDDFTTFNSTGSANVIDTYALDDTLPAGAVVSQIEAFLHAIGTTSDVVQVAIRSGATNYFSANKNLTNGVWADFSNVWATNPATSLAWTKSDIDALEAGMKYISGAGASVTQVWVVVTYTLASGLVESVTMRGSFRGMNRGQG